jgi:hypothetical protein
MKLTSELLYKKIEQFYHNDYIKNSNSYQNLLVIKNEKSYYISLTQKLTETETLKYTTINTEQTNSGYQTLVAISYSNTQDARYNTQMVPVRFENEVVIPPPILENLIQFFRNYLIDTVLL